MGGVANPLEFAKEREVTRGPHVFDHGTYVADPGFQGTEYPKWMFKDKKSALAKNEDEEIFMTENGYSTEPPKQPLIEV